MCEQLWNFSQKFWKVKNLLKQTFFPQAFIYFFILTNQHF